MPVPASTTRAGRARDHARATPRGHLALAVAALAAAGQVARDAVEQRRARASASIVDAGRRRAHAVVGVGLDVRAVLVGVEGAHATTLRALPRVMPVSAAKLSFRTCPIRVRRPVARVDRRGAVPRHVAIVMDGNGRWAQRQGLPRTEGHAAGEEALARHHLRRARRSGCKRADRLRVLDRELAPAGRRGPLPHELQRGLLAAARRTSCTTEGVRITFSGRRDWRVPARRAAPRWTSAEG